MNSNPVQNEHKRNNANIPKYDLKEMVADNKMRPPERIRTWWNKQTIKQQKKREKRERKKNSSVTHASAQCLDIACDNNVLNAERFLHFIQRKKKDWAKERKIGAQTETFLFSFIIRFDCTVGVVVGCGWWCCGVPLRTLHKITSYLKNLLVRALLRCDRCRHT